MDVFQIAVLAVLGYAFVSYLFVLLMDAAAGQKLDRTPLFLATFFLSPIFGVLVAIVNVISKQGESKEEEEIIKS